MTRYEIQTFEGPERGIRVTCTEHGESEEYQPGYRRVAFACSDCGVEVEVTLRTLDDWRDLGEMC